MLHAKGSLQSAHNEKVPDHGWGVGDISHSQLNPTLQILDRFGVKVKHFTLLRQDEGRLAQVVRAIRCGGWPLTREEVQWFNRFGDDMLLADQVVHVWNEKSPELTPGQKKLQYSPSQGTPGYDQLIYVQGLPLRQIYEKLCSHPGIDAEQMKEKVWPELIKWERWYKPPQAGYYLLEHLEGKKFGDWGHMARYLEATTNSTRAHPGVIFEAFVSYLFIVGRPGVYETFEHFCEVGKGKYILFGGLQDNFLQHPRIYFKIEYLEAVPEKPCTTVLCKKWDL